MPVSAMCFRYHDILLEQVWLFSQEDIPALKSAVTALLHNPDNSEAGT